jgi:hypothetical protein
VYPSGTYAEPSPLAPCDLKTSLDSRAEVRGMSTRATPRPAPGACLPWDEKVKDLPEICGDKDLIRNVWENIEGLASTYIWQVLLSF